MCKNQVQLIDRLTLALRWLIDGKDENTITYAIPTEFSEKRHSRLFGLPFRRGAGNRPVADVTAQSVGKRRNEHQNPHVVDTATHRYPNT